MPFAVPNLIASAACSIRCSNSFACFIEIRSRHAPVSTNHMRIQCARSDSVTRSSVAAEHAIDVVFAFVCPFAVLVVSSFVGVLEELLLFVFVLVVKWCNRLWSVSRLMGESGRPVGVICPGLSMIVSSSDSSLGSLILFRLIRAKFLIMSASPGFWSCATVALPSATGGRSLDLLLDLRLGAFVLVEVGAVVSRFMDASW